MGEVRVSKVMKDINKVFWRCRFHVKNVLRPLKSLSKDWFVFFR